MKDNEFSRPKAEFSPVGQEFSRPKAEFAPPGREHHGAGKEFHQTAAPTKQKKKKGVNSLMLTTAAVVTTGVVLTGAISHTYRQDFPSTRLDPVYCEYLDTFRDALEKRDEPHILELTQDPLIWEMMEEDILPYYRMLRDQHGLVSEHEDGSYTYFREDYSEDRQRDIWCDFYYDGKQINPQSFSDDCQFIWTDLWETETSSYISLSMSNELQDHTWQDRFSVHVSYNAQQEPNQIELSFMPEIRWEDHGSYSSWYMKNGLWKDYRLAGELPVLLIGEGDYREAYFDEAHEYWDAWVENGRLTVHVDRGSGYQEEEIIPIRNGAVELTERMYVEKYEHDVDEEGRYWYYLYYRVSENQEEVIGYGYAESEEDFLRHAINIWWW